MTDLRVEHSWCSRQLQGVHSLDPQAADVGKQTWHPACLDKTAQTHTPVKPATLTHESCMCASKHRSSYQFLLC